jgi:hypothetical protein
LPGANAGKWQASLHEGIIALHRKREETGMLQLLETPPETFVDRRRREELPATYARERRQFSDSHEELSPAAKELATAIDTYKLSHRRRFITYEEMLAVVQSLGYRKTERPAALGEGASGAVMAQCESRLVMR